MTAITWNALSHTYMSLSGPHADLSRAYPCKHPLDVRDRSLRQDSVPQIEDEGSREALGEDPFSGTIFVFRCKRADRVKILAWDGSGLVLFWKRLEHGAFRWPPISDGMMRLTASQLAALVDGMDWLRLHARDVARPTATS